ncbi:transcription factor RcaD [Scytonema sp. UIC 10036]|uniref:transcription factor RcaD n=1 Tax=Scytonema sp. UIC 10036 TaxID=2304196 RepID=UPI0012DA5514|nr:transcription factor RcaD [Scytonema sp. UIC 10036]MUG99282.1 transcription factor RcaD [Scytonema sp. UIC 10036]
MDTNELKFLLKLLGCANYRASLGANTFNSFKGKDKICKSLGDRELISFSREIASVKILPPGRALLKPEVGEIPLTPNELKLLERISKASGKIPPSEIGVKSVKSEERDAILQGFHDKGLVEVETKIKRTKAEVWLTERGIEYLRDDYNPKGAAIISLDLLNNYVRFLRKSLHSQPDLATTTAPTDAESPVVTNVNLTDEEILRTIEKLDRELGSDNYLPIFHLRQKLQPPLSRDELDKALYRLEESDQIEMSSLAEPGDYSSEQIDAGIPQISGGSLFFITVN